ncbi:MAG: hypothetical protein ACRC2R_19430 [Xenococcaceae cyanobacterium]
MSKLHVAARCDRYHSIAFLKVANLMASPESLLYPKISLRVLLGNILSGLHEKKFPMRSTVTHKKPCDSTAY